MAATRLRNFVEAATIMVGLIVMALNASGVTAQPYLASVLWVLVGLAVIDLIWRHLPERKWWWLARGVVAILVTIAVCFLIRFSFRLGRSPLADRQLPGFDAILTMELRSADVERRQYFIDFKTPENSEAVFYLSADSRPTFVITDVKGESYSLIVPIGKDGIPLNRFIYLTLQVGVSNNATYMRALVNSNEVKSETLDFPLDLGSKHWLGMIGADEAGHNNSAFAFKAWAIGHVTLTDSQINAYNGIVKAALDRVGNRRSR